MVEEGGTAHASFPLVTKLLEELIPWVHLRTRFILVHRAVSVFRFAPVRLSLHFDGQ